MYTYKVGEDTYTLPENEVEGFLKTFPDAQQIEEDLEKTNGSQTEDATASQVGTASKSENISSEFPAATDNPETVKKAKEAGLDVVPGARQEGDMIKGVTLPEVEIIPLEKQQEDLTKEIEEYNAEMKNATNVVNTFYNQNIAPYVGEDKLLPADFNKETLKEFNDLRTAYFKVEDLSKDFEAKQLDLNERKEVYRKTGYDLQDAIAEADKIKLSQNTNLPKALIPYLSGAQAVTLELGAGLVDFVDNYGYKPLAALATGKTVEEIIEEGEYEIPTEKLSYAAAKLRSHMTEYRDEDGKALDYVDLFQKGEIGKGAQVLSEQAFSNIPSLALSIGFPVLGSAALGASVGGSGFEEDLKNRPDATVGQLYASNSGKALSEWGTEFLGGTLFRGINRLRKAGASEAVVKEFAENYVANTTKKIAVGGFGEGATEGVNSAIQQSINEAVFDDEISTTEFVRTVVHDFGIGAALGGPASGVTSAATRIQKEQAYNALAPTEFKKQQFEIAKMLDSRVKQLEGASANEKADLEQEIKDLNNIQVANKKALYRTFDTMNNKELKTYAQNLDIVNKEINKAKRKNADEVVKQKAEIAINNAFKANNEIIDQATNKRREKLFENVSLQAEALKEEGVNVDIKKGNSSDFIDWRRDDESASFDLGAIEAMDEIIKNPSSTKEEVAEAKKMKESQTKQFEAKEEVIKGESTRYGAIRQDGKGGLEIFINQESELRDGVMTTATHEFGHALLFATLQGDPAARKAFGDALLEGFDENGIAIEGTDFKRRLDQYTEAEGKSEEVFTLAAEAVQNGDIKFNDNLFGRLKDVVKRFTKNRTGLEYKFNNNQDVFNFFRDYVESVESGNINKDLIKSAAKGIKGKVLPSDIKPGSVEQFSKVYQEVETMKADLVNPDTKQGTAFIIADTLSNEVDRRLPRIEGITAEERADIVRNFTLDDNRGLVGLLNNYNPDRNDSIMGYLNSSTPGGKLLDARLQEFYKDDPRFGQIFQTTTDEAVATKVERETAIEEEAADVIETGRKTKGKVIANELNIADKVKSEVAEANIDVDALTNFKSVPSAAPKTVGELLGINPIKLQRTVIDEETGEKIKNKKFKANLTAGEVASAQRWFNANRQLVIDSLPKGFDVGGQATGVPRTVLDALYTKKETRAKTAAGLKGQVKRANIKDSEFLALVDIINGKPNRNRDTSARIIAIADLLSKVITNQEVRQTVPGTERIRSGMSEVMFSKADELIQVNPEFEGDLKNISKLLNTFIDEGIFKHNTVEQIDLFYEQVENVWAKNLPKDLITKTVLRPSNRILPNKGKDTITVDGVETTIDAYYTKKRDEFIAREDVKYGEAFSEEGADYKYGRTYGSMFGLTAKDISKANSNGTIARINKENLSMHKQLWQRVNESIKADPKNAKAWGNYFSLVGQDVTHPHRMGAEMIGWTTKPKGHKGRMYEWEHAMPATRAYLYLMEASLDENINFESAYDLVINNFKLIALDKADDMKLKAAGRQTSMGKGWTVFDNWYDRYFDKEVAKQGGIDPKGIQSLDGRTFDQVYNVNIEGAAAITLPIEGKANISQSISNVRPVLQYSKDSKGMSTFDFDETLIIDGENFVTATKDGDVVKIPSDKWPIDGPRYAEEGYDFDFSDFVNVRGGKEGPLLQKMKNQIKKYGPKNVFVLTARMQEAAEPIHKWLKSKGINIPLENITGLGKSEGDAKAQWFIDKYAEGYNDMYFVDDALPNVEAVQDVFNQLDIKGKSVRAIPDITKQKIQFSKTELSSTVNSPQYKQFKDSIKDRVLYHGGSETINTIRDNNAVWFYLDDADAAQMWGDGEVYSVKASDIQDMVIIPDLNDVSTFTKHIQEKFNLGNKAYDVREIMSHPKADEIIKEWIEWSAENNMEYDLGYNLYEKGKVTNGAAVTVLGVIPKNKIQQISSKFSKSSLRGDKAVKNVFNQLDVKGKSVQARINFSKDLSSEFNKMLERTKGVAAEKRFSRVVGQKRGKNIGRYRFFVPPSAEDFAGLLYDFYGKGSQGNADMEFMKKALLDPFGRADREMSIARMSILDDYKMLRKELPGVKKKLGKIIDKNTGFTFDNAVRVYLFDKAGFEVPGISKRDLEYLRNVVRTDQDLKTFADTLSVISKRKEGYIEPGENWSVETIASDLENIVNKIGRKQYLAEFIENKNIIFSPENMNKIEAIYGSRFRSALEDSLYRMENGTNRSQGRSYGQAWTNWVNGSVGAIMFFNARSAVLQTLSTVNFINYDDNNIFAAGKALANQKQYWSDFSTLFNSDFLKARRAGLQINVNEAELANAVAGAQNKAKAALAYLLKKGFLPTQMADSFAIASGGSTFYRNRIKTYVKQGMNQKAAEEKAFLDFQEIAQETQQSSRPDRISQQQASPLGRLILAFANTPMQYNRLIKKAARDLINNRGDWRSNISRILYYGAIQNVIFSSLQQAIFALSFDDEEDDALDRRTMRVANGMMDTILRGSGVTGAAVATIKNTIMRFIEESERGSRADYGQVAVEVTQVSPPMGSKMRKLYSALNAYKFNREIMGSMDTFDYNNPVWDAAAKVTTATTNVPLDRLFRKTDNIREALNQENTAMQRSFLALGWSSWDLQVGERVVVNKGKKNEYVKYLDTKRQAQQEAKEELKETKKKEKKARQQQCTKIKSNGSRCKMMVNKPKTRCHYHD